MEQSTLQRENLSLDNKDADGVQPAQKPIKVPIIGAELPAVISNDLHKFQHEFGLFRGKVLHAAPAAVVNHSTNVIGGVHLASEVCMMMASVKPSNKEELKKPVQVVFKNLKKSFQTAFSRGYEMKDGVKIHTGNPWSARSTLAGISLMGLAAITPDRKDSEEDVDRMVKLATESPVQYGLERVKQSLTLTDGRYKRQHVGLGLMLTGLFSCIGGTRNVNYEKNRLERNTAHSIGGAITAIAATQLLFSLDNEQGWSRFGSTLWTRLFFVPKAILKKIDGKDNWQMYTLGQIGLQTTNTLAATIGGATKNPDGTIVDSKAIREEIKEKYQGLREGGKAANADEVPDARGQVDALPDAANVNVAPTSVVSNVQSERTLQEEPDKPVAVSAA